MTNAMQFQPLQIAQLPLQGIRLIEASAGTGKTYTIAMLYLRLVLGHGLPQRYLPPDILVLTFTEAAASELRDRIRSRLNEAALAFRGLQAPDKALAEIMRAYPEDSLSQQAFVLEQAAEWLDEAAISTIHAWCLRVLQQHAFDSGSLFSLRLVKDLRDRRDAVVRDIWREWFYPLAAADARKILGLLGSPDELSRRLDGLMSANPAQICFDGRPANQSWQAALAANKQQQAMIDQAWLQVHQHWQHSRDEVCALLDQAVTTGQLSKGMYSNAIRTKLYASFDRSDANAPSSIKSFEKMTPSELVRATNKGKTTPTHPFFDLVQVWIDVSPSVAALDDALTLALLNDLQQAVSAALHLSLNQTGELSFDDLLTQLDKALSGPDAATLAQRLRSRFPVALIDEFQDTDPLQFRLFSRLYDQRQWSAQEQGSTSALLMIGDPKQAIYSFRGADLPTYLQARLSAQQPCYTLDTNFRSDQPLVEAINTLFSYGDAFANGVFRQGLDANGLPFHPVQAARHESALQFKSEQGWLPVKPLQLLLPNDDESCAKLAAQDYLANACAAQISRWLTQSEAGQLRLTHNETPVVAGDIAVLVRTRYEADAMRQALQARSISSVYGSDRDSVYASVEAQQLQLWLEALHHPEDEARLRLALATPLLGYEWSRLAELRVDERAWEALLTQALQCQQCWQQEGVLSAIRRWLFVHQVPARLLSPDTLNGERALTNLLHLAELLQTASVELQGEYALIRYLAEHIAEAGRSDQDEAMLRLESDSQRVRIVTLHQSKGLEYPLVCMPFSSMPGGIKDGRVRHYHNDQQRNVADLDMRKDSDATARAAAEQLQEDMRLFYVGVTRARHLLWTAVMPVRVNKASTVLDYTPWAVLLTGETHVAGAAELREKLAQLLVPLAPYCETELASFSEIPLCTPITSAVLSADALLPARTFAGLATRSWWISSYSALSHSEQAYVPAPLAELVDDARAAIVDEERSQSLSDLPRGAETGTFWHELLEFAAEHHFGRDENDMQRIQQELQIRCELRGWEAQIETLTEALPNWLRQPFALPTGQSVALADLQELYVELEFWLESSNVNVTELDAVISRYCLPGQPRPALTPLRLNGLFKGFIDLVFSHQGRYYLLDYKSNYLGDLPEDYRSEQVAKNLLSHRYDVQYALYLLALHRLLRSRLANYDYDQHIGGAVYLYLRGRSQPDTGVFSQYPPRQLVDELDALFMGAAAITGAA
ncbi:MAG: exodeoxyribonuclease V subunit beta [Moraxellaceae bacterium]|nr:exodeoxyribonuclease V subunit beta [Moraxellaceae bacterium]MDZ4387678.1 exodeoxyribonuclease V subunit beta [Moraxellaceae bacterium]